MTLKAKDFIEVEYTGRTKDEGFVFDTTSAEVAKSEGIFSPRGSYGPVIICLGQGHLVQGMDRQLIGKELGTHIITVQPEEGFGKKSAKLIHLIPTSKFKKEQIMPQPGLQVNVDGQMGIIKTVSGGRTLVDFNHPLSGKELVYHVEAKRLITDDTQKLKALLTLQLGLPDPDAVVKEGKATISFPQELPKEIAEPIAASIKDVLGLSEVSFVKKEVKAPVTKGDKEELQKGNKQDHPSSQNIKTTQ